MHNLRLMPKERFIYFDNCPLSPKNDRPICDQPCEAHFTEPLVDINCSFLLQLGFLFLHYSQGTLAQKYIRSNHFLSVNVNLAKKLSSHINFLLLHLGKHQLTPSDTSLLLSIIGTPHLTIMHTVV